MIRIFIAMAIVVLLLIGWFLLQPIARNISQLDDAARKFAGCIDAHGDEIDVLVRQTGDVRSWNDIEYNQYRAKLKMKEIQGACLEQSGFKALVLRELDNTTLSDAEKASIKRELAEAETFGDLERIEREIARAER